MLLRSVALSRFDSWGEDSTDFDRVFRSSDDATS